MRAWVLECIRQERGQLWGRNEIVDVDFRDTGELASVLFWRGRRSHPNQLPNTASVRVNDIDCDGGYPADSQG